MKTELSFNIETIFPDKGIPSMTLLLETSRFRNLPHEQQLVYTVKLRMNIISFCQCPIYSDFIENYIPPQQIYILNMKVWMISKSLSVLFAVLKKQVIFLSQAQLSNDARCYSIGETCSSHVYCN